MYTDADIEMAELAEMGNAIANGVCPACTDALTEGGESPLLSGYHAHCVDQCDRCRMVTTQYEWIQNGLCPECERAAYR